MNGRITTIKRSKGFGFIKDSEGQDRFFHANCCDTPFEQLQEQIAVEFEPYVDPERGQRARRVKAL